MRMNWGLRFTLAALSWLLMLAGAQSALAANNTLHYYGGPVAHSMNVVLVEWGSSVRSTYTDSNTGDPAFFSYLASQSGSTMDIGGVLAQYMDTTGKNSQNAYSYDEMAQATGTSVIMGMSIATVLGIFITPVLFVVMERLVGGSRPEPAPAVPPASVPEPHGKAHA